MKKSPILKILFILIFIFAVFVAQVSAAVDPAIQTRSSGTLVKLQLMRGDEKGNLNLQNKVTRAEFITMAIRMLGHDRDNNLKDIDIPFKDITDKYWAYNNIKIAIKYKLVTGYIDNTIRPNNNVTFTEAQAILVRALGYESTMTGNWPDNVINKSIELGLNRNLDLPKDKQITRGEASVLIYNSLTVNFNR